MRWRRSTPTYSLPRAHSEKKLANDTVRGVVFSGLFPAALNENGSLSYSFSSSFPVLSTTDHEDDDEDDF
jgi:hypothetical protein